MAAAGSNGDDRVYRAVAAGASAGEVRRVIEECAQGSAEQRVQAFNHEFWDQVTEECETPLQAAHRQKRGDVVGALLEAGADVGGIFEGKLTPLAVCIAYGQVDSVRALLRMGHKVDEPIGWDPVFDDAVRKISCLPVHFCLAPPPLGTASDRVDGHERYGALQLGCLEVLLREGDADANALDRPVAPDPDDNGDAPIFWLAQGGLRYEKEDEEDALRLLVAEGARTSGIFCNARTPLMMAAWHSNARVARFLIEEAGAPVDERDPRYGYTALHTVCECHEGTETVALLLLDRGAVLDTMSPSCGPPLFAACGSADETGLLRDDFWPVFEEILRRSSAEARRYVRPDNGSSSSSAVDLLAVNLRRRSPRSAFPSEEDLRVQQRCRWVIAELLKSGAPVRPETAAAALPLLAARGQRLHGKMSNLRSELLAAGAPIGRKRSAALPPITTRPEAEACSCAHELMAGLAMDFGELRAAGRAVADRRARVAALEREMGAGS